MNVLFNRWPVQGPWGGGSKVLGEIIASVQKSGHIAQSVPNNPDIVFCMDPRPASGFLDYESLRSLNIPIVQRVGDVGTHGKHELFELLRKTLPFADMVIFPSIWAMEQCKGMFSKGIVIENAPQDVFYKYRSDRITVSNPIRVVTHHWSNNPMKGFDIYREIAKDPNIEFTFIGRSDGSVQSAAVMDAEQLAAELPRHDIYLTASRKEAGANHVLEALAAGLPVVYHEDGGSISEYCANRGSSYSTPAGAISVIMHIARDYHIHKEQAMLYRNKMKYNAEAYVAVLEGVFHENKHKH